MKCILVLFWSVQGFLLQSHVIPCFVWIVTAFSFAGMKHSWYGDIRTAFPWHCSIFIMNIGQLQKLGWKTPFPCANQYWRRWHWQSTELSARLGRRGEDSNAEGGQHTDPGLPKHNCISRSLSTVFLPYGQMYFFIQKRCGEDSYWCWGGDNTQNPSVLKHHKRKQVTITLFSPLAIFLPAN